ncbi:hypothetical protein QCE62_05535 [Caballeronia sp. LZ033]|uniref:hypothetical protein n=1 Tax=Caballeronia sp. LZ033 TaxID=3038566 RepID=UPI00285E30CF|nr:hypothetical protein [Caballeronia sp. LZ033]MDR5813051.1 hypothetical protein [Caballeronia sp. LZ033]
MSPEEFAVFHDTVRHTLNTASSLTMNVATKMALVAKNLNPEAPGTISVYESLSELASLSAFFDQQLAGLATVTWGREELTQLCTDIANTLNAHRAEVFAHAAVEADLATHDAPATTQ